MSSISVLGHRNHNLSFVRDEEAPVTRNTFQAVCVYFCHDCNCEAREYTGRILRNYR